MPLDLARIRALCFDVDGTLSDTDDLYVRRLSGWLRTARLPLNVLDRARLARRIVMKSEDAGNLLYGLPDRLGVDGPLERLREAADRKGRNGKPTFLLIEGVVEMLARLQPHYPMAVVSARNERGTRRFLRRFELEAFFPHVCTAQTCRYTKPFPDPVRWAAGRMGVPPENCLMIGDTTVDIRAGRAAGAQTVGVLCGFGEADELRRAGADLILAHTALVGDLLLEGRSLGTGA